MESLSRMLIIPLMIIGVNSFAVEQETLVDIPILPGGPGLIDGMFNEECWGKALKTGKFKSIKSGKQITEEGEAYFFADKDNLYVGFIGYFKDRKAKQKNIDDINASPFCGDRMELFIAPGDTGNYTQIAVGLNGKVWVQPRGGELAHGMQVLDDRYQIEMKIPFSSLRVIGKTFSDQWAINIGRGNSALNEKEYSSWAPLVRGSFHDMDSFYRTTSLKADLSALLKKQKSKITGKLELCLSHMLYDKSPVIVKTELQFDTTLKKHQYQVVIKDQQGKTVADFIEKPVFLTNDINIPIDKLPEGRYEVAVTLLDPKGKPLENAKTDFWKIPPKKNHPKINYTIEDHNIFKNGKLFFPIGASNLGTMTLGWPQYRNRRFDKQRFLKAYNDRLEELRNLGFNTVINNSYFYPDAAKMALETKSKQINNFFFPWDNKERIRQLPYTFNDVCQMCADHDIAVIARLHFRHPIMPQDIDDWLKVMLKYREYDNILAWRTADETDGLVDYNHKSHQLHKELDPDRLTWLTVINAVAANKDAADIMATDPYPIPNDSMCKVGYHAQNLAKIYQDKKTQSKWLWIQAFGGEPPAWPRSPIGEELRCLVFIAMNCGINGIMYFLDFKPLCERDGIRTMRQEGYEEMARTNKQVEELAPVYCLGKRLFEKFDWDGFYTAVIEYRSDIYVSVVNTNKKESKPFNWDLPEGARKNGEANVLYENRLISFKDGVIKDHFNPYEVHIYKIIGR